MRGHKLSLQNTRTLGNILRNNFPSSSFSTSVMTMAPAPKAIQITARPKGLIPEWTNTVSPALTLALRFVQ